MPTLEPRDFESVDEYVDAYASECDRLYDEWKDGTLSVSCADCGQPLSEREAVHTGRGMMHEACAERRWPTCQGDGTGVFSRP